jgi:hypothetical protein
MLLRLLIVVGLCLATAPARAENGAAMNGADGRDAWAVEVLRGAEVWRDFGRNGRAGIEVRMGRPGIRVHDPATPPEGVLRVHSATREPAAAAIPSHGVADAFDPSRIPVQRLHRTAGDTRIRTHGLRDAGRRGGIRIHGFGGRGI